jgi:NAD(P)-dependent dehydrogenase (short-subunit alcohol dehydrogenase family)
MTQMQELKATRALVTGAGVRIGRQIAIRFAQAGARVVVHYNRSEGQARALLEELDAVSPGHECVCADLLNVRERRELIPGLLRHGQTLNCLVNNAAVYRRCPLTKVDAERLREDYEINFVAPFLLMCDFAQYCEEGNIINLLDQRVATVDPSASTYGFAKKSLRDATEAAAVQWAPRIRVNAVAPGLVLPPPGVPDGRMERLLVNVPMAQTSSAEEIADACLFLAMARTITGQVLYVDGGLHLVGPAVPEVEEADYSE